MAAKKQSKYIIKYSVSHSLKKGQGAGQKKGTFDAWNSPKRALLLEQTFQMWAR